MDFSRRAWNLDTWEKHIHNLALRLKLFVHHSSDVGVHCDLEIGMTHSVAVSTVTSWNKSYEGVQSLGEAGRNLRVSLGPRLMHPPRD